METGTILVYWTLFLGVLSLLASFAFLYLRKNILLQASKALLYLTFLASTGIFLLLAYYFLIPNLNIAYVHGHTSISYPWYYKLSGLWAGEEGTIVLWIWVISLSMVVEELLQKKKKEFIERDASITLYEWIRTISLIILVAFLILLARIDVFETTQEVELAQFPDGYGMNRLLLTPLMLAHPLVEFAGYAFMTIPLASALSYLITGNKRWTEVSLQWSRLSWLFLSLGIGIGALWAYISLGWGGYWAWDPVEVGNLIPWIALTCFVHTQQYFRKRGQYLHVAPLMAIITFVLVIFATFETRSGFVTSPLHAFTGPGAGISDPALRLVAILEENVAVAFFMAMMLSALIAGGILFMWRFMQIRKKEGLLTDVAYISSVFYILFLAVLLGYAMLNVASFVSLGLDLAGFAGHKGIGLAILAILLMSLPLMWILFTAREVEEESKPITLSSIINDKNAMVVSIAIFGIWFTVTFLLMVLGSEGLQPEVFTSRLPFIIVALAIAMTVCLVWRYLGRKKTGYLAIALVVIALIGSLAFSNPFSIYIPVLIAAFLASFTKVIRVGAGSNWRERKLKMVISGSFIFTAGTVGMLFWSNLTKIYFILPGVKPDLMTGFLGMIASSLAMIGSLFALRGRSIQMSIVGAVAATLSLGFFFIGTVLGLVALGLIWSSRSSFSKASIDGKAVRSIIGGAAPHFIHFGIVLLLIGYAASTYLSVEKRMNVVKSPVGFAGYEFEITGSVGMDEDGDGFYEDIKAYVEITRDGALIDNATFHLWWMDPSSRGGSPHYMLDIYVENTYFEDLYLIPRAFMTSDGRWIAAHENTGNMFTSSIVDVAFVEAKTLPLINALWGGMWTIVLGIGLLIFVDYLPLPIRPSEKRPKAKLEVVREVSKEEAEKVMRDDDYYERLLEEELKELEEKL